MWPRVPKIDEPQESSIPTQCQAAARLSACIMAELRWAFIPAFEGGRFDIAGIGNHEAPCFEHAAVVFDTEADIHLHSASFRMSSIARWTAALSELITLWCPFFN